MILTPLVFPGQTMDKLKQTGQNSGQVFDSSPGCVCISRVIANVTKRPNLKLKTRAKQLLGSLLFAFALPGQTKKLTNSGLPRLP